MVDRREQRVKRTATQSKSRKAIPLGSASGSAGKEGLVSNDRTTAAADDLPEPPRLGSGEGSIAEQKLLVADILVIDCASVSGIPAVLGLLGGLRVDAVSTVGGFQQHLQGLKSEGPCIVLCVACSRDNESRGFVDQTLRTVGSRPALVIDECFDHDYAHLLLERGALDYLDADRLSSEELHRRIEWAILRNGHRATAAAITSNHGIANDGGDASETQPTLDSLAPRGRQVLELLATGLTPKQIAFQLGTSPKTIWNQLAELRLRFNVDSNHALGLLVLPLITEENARE